MMQMITALTGTGGPKEENPVRFINIKSSPEIKNTEGLSNAITTTKYSLLSWLPKSILEQFRRIANVYFLVISILMLIGTYATYLFISPLDPYSTVFTLVFVLMVTSLKEGSEDLSRYRSDKSDNQRKVTIVTFDSNGNEVLTEVENQMVQAGDIIKLIGRSQIPCDMLLILTSLHHDGNQCFVETTNLDGETNLKVKEAPPAIKTLLRDGKFERHLVDGFVETEQPQKDITKFIGAYKCNANSEQGAIPLSIENLLLRGCVFSNTDWCYGVALYVGQESKIQLNSRAAPSKMSKVEEKLNTAIIIIFTAQVILVSISVISVYLLGFDTADYAPYIYPEGSVSDSVLPLWLERWFVFFLLYNNFIPISLYVTIELVNLGQGVLISSDPLIYDEDLDCACAVRSSNLCQELGMVSNVFSDKTGTLTRNEMKLVKFVVDGVLFDCVSSLDTPHGPVDSPAQAELKKPGGGSSKLFDFMRCLSTCHTVIREKDGTYRAESPDELALVTGVGCFGNQLMERGTVEMTVQLMGAPTTYDVLAVNPFNSDRKRNSVLVRDKQTKEYFVLCKGADATTLPLCNMTADERKRVDKYLLDLAVLGLRTLCIYQKKLTKEAAEAWFKDYKAAAASLSDRAQKLEAAASALEQDLQLLGITAIEDRLQDEVPEVIADLAKAGIIVWMLTGDKEETAISIGRSCNLLLADTKVIFLTQLRSREAYNAKLKEVYDDIQAKWTPGAGYREQGKLSEVALVMDGDSFRFFSPDDPSTPAVLGSLMEDHRTQRKYLLAIGKACRSVVACRLTPLQKQMVVNVVKVDTVPESTTLAIGDGANDVSMIREGNVGVGIYGKEGRQAANNADFAIGQFKFLRRLLLVHGRWNYRRQAAVFLYCMHKNMVLTLTLFWFSYFDAVSGTSPYESWVYTGFNFILGLPIIFYGIQDRDLSDEFVCKYPQTYSTGRENTYLQVPAISLWILNACLYAVLICLLSYYTAADTFQSLGLYSMGTTTFVGLCMSLQFKVAYLNHQWDWVRAFVMSISIAGMFFYFYVISDSMYDYWYETDFLYADSFFWFWGFWTVPVFVAFIDVIGYEMYVFFRPTKEILYREAEHNGVFAADPLLKLASSLHPTASADKSQSIFSRDGASAMEMGGMGGSSSTPQTAPQTAPQRKITTRQVK